MTALRRSLRFAAALTAAAGLLATAPHATAQTSNQPTAPPLVTVAPDGLPADAETTTPVAVVAVLRGPGGVGYWVVGADGAIEAVGTSILPTASDPPPLEAPVVGARLGAPGALGVWLLLADGSEVAVGDPGPTVLTGQERPLGWLSGVGVRQLLRGAWWNDVDRQCTSELSLPVRIGQTIMATLGERSLGLAVEEARDRRIGGVLVQGPVTEHVWRRIAEVQDFAGRVPLLFAVDEEGGRVQRLAEVLGRLPSAAAQTAMPPSEVADRAAKHARKMSELGFTMNFAPVIDVGAGEGIGDRSFGDDPATVAEYGTATVEGLSAGGIVPVVKHFPGHGAASADTHDRAAATASLEDLRRRDLIPFAAVIGATDAAVMVGHLTVPGLTGGLPASLSPAAIDGVLRGDLGHSGLVVTDSLTMGAIRARWTVNEAAVLAIVAGADVALVGGVEDAAAAFAALEAAVDAGRLSLERLDDAATNVLRAKGVYACTLVGRDGLGRTVLYDPTLVGR
ncbi:glycoside hydrolase family 3 N-terminal domain-containing protein [Candidatus Poriferisodalis sp.]|uniref:glycoside hydrolase family 3 N-terminal domain-containing protein n=1 Tax=Candidatus Poriferisodalis sp. TaxID=3101277 RepID=UPI003B012D84